MAIHRASNSIFID